MAEVRRSLVHAAWPSGELQAPCRFSASPPRSPEPPRPSGLRWLTSCPPLESRQPSPSRGPAGRPRSLLRSRPFCLPQDEFPREELEDADLAAHCADVLRPLMTGLHALEERSSPCTDYDTKERPSNANPVIHAPTILIGRCGGMPLVGARTMPRWPFAQDPRSWSACPSTR